MIKFRYYKSPVGELKIASFGECICLCDWRYRRMRQAIDVKISKDLDSEMTEADSDELIDFCIQQLEEYFTSKREEFSLPIKEVGTNFQKEVWSALRDIPFGKTKTYLELSRSLGNEAAIRAVASANGANALSILNPCHRIIGSDGSLVGYAGGLAAKKALLKLEGVFGYQKELF